MMSRGLLGEAQGVRCTQSRDKGVALDWLGCFVASAVVNRAQHQFTLKRRQKGMEKKERGNKLGKGGETRPSCAAQSCAR